MKNYFNTKFRVSNFDAVNAGLISKWLDMSDFDTHEDLVSELLTQGFKLKDIEKCSVVFIQADGPVIDVNKETIEIEELFDNVKLIDDFLENDACVKKGNRRTIEHFGDFFKAIIESIGFDDFFDAIKNGNINDFKYYPYKTLKEVALKEIEEIKRYLGNYTLTIYEQVCSCVNIDEYISMFLDDYVETKYGVIKINN